MGTWRGVELEGLHVASERLQLRPLTTADAPAVLAATQDGSLHRFLHQMPDPYTAADADEFVTSIAQSGRRDGTGFECGVEVGGRLVGTAALRLPTGRLTTGAEIGYAIYPGHRGRGYATEASRALTDWAFAHGVERVHIRCQVDNVASARVALAAGYRFEGVTRGYVATAAGPRDGALFGRLRHDAGRAIAAFPSFPAGGLTDGVVRLRIASPADLDAVMEELTDPLSLRWAVDYAPSRAAWAAGLAHAELDWLLGRILRIALVDEASDTVAGSMRVRMGELPRLGNVGYGLRAEFRGRGYTARALRLLTGWAFGPGGLTRLELGAKTDNVASQRAAVDGGFFSEGVMRGRLPNADGTSSDEARFAAVATRQVQIGAPAP